MDKKCPECNQNFESIKRKKYLLNYGTSQWENKFCSQSCAGKYSSRQRIRFNKENIPLGAKKRDKNNYIYIWDGEQWRSEHRITVENKLRRKLRKGEIIHHIDGKKDNNKIENLQLMVYLYHCSAIETQHTKDINNLLKDNEKLKELLRQKNKTISAFIIKGLKRSRIDF